MRCVLVRLQGGLNQCKISLNTCINSNHEQTIFYVTKKMGSQDAELTKRCFWNQKSNKTCQNAVFPFGNISHSADSLWVFSHN